MDAVNFREVLEDDQEWVQDKIAKVDHEVHPLFEERFSPRAFSERPVSCEAVRSIFEAVRWAPSSRNEQPWAFIVARREDNEAFSRLLGHLGESNQRWAKKAPVLVAAFARAGSEEGGNKNAYAWHDVGIATGFMLLQSTALGLSVHVMGGVDKAQLVKTYNVPSDWQAVSAFAIGYLGDPEELPADLKEREFAARSRREQDTFVFEGKWGP